MICVCVSADDHDLYLMCLQASVDSSASAVASRPRRRWSCRVGSLELMVKSMLELRQLDSLSEAPVQSRSCADRLRDEDRCSTSSLQVTVTSVNNHLNCTEHSFILNFIDIIKLYAIFVVIVKTL